MYTVRDDGPSSSIMKSACGAPNGHYRTPNESSGSDTQPFSISARWGP
jgi:hypothetical protein